MTHKYAHEVEVGTKWERKTYNPLIGAMDKDGAVTHTVCIGFKHNPEGPDDPCTFTDDQSWAGVLAACGFCTKSESRRRGFTGDVPVGFTERRVAANMVLYVWRKWEGCTLDHAPLTWWQKVWEYLNSLRK